MRTLISNFEDRLNKFESSTTTSIGEIKRKQEEVELKTYCKIKDYEELLTSRVSETYLQGIMTEERGRLQRQFKEMLEYRSEESNRRYEVLGVEQRHIRESLEDKIESLTKLSEDSGKK